MDPVDTAIGYDLSCYCFPSFYSILPTNSESFLLPFLLDKVKIAHCMP